MIWSPQQNDALVRVSNWIKDKNGAQVFKLFGWAGTGKSTLAVHLSQGIGKVCFAAFTGKAALVMRRRGCIGAGTIHSLIYTPAGDSDEETGDPTFRLSHDSDAATAKLIVIDEVSMVNEELARDLLSFGKKVLVLGDPFQLPPVKGTGFFTDGEPDIMLTEIHRQAKDNPIIRLSIDIREGRGLDYGVYGDSKVIHRTDIETQEVMAADQILVGRNKTRVSYNGRVRHLKGFSAPTPMLHDRIVCLKNNKEKRLLNGQMFVVTKVVDRKDDAMKLQVLAEDGKISIPVVTNQAFFDGTDEGMAWADRRKFDEFTFGYALTVHKSQGSQWDNVYLFDEGGAFREDAARWRYTALTRAAEKITVVR